MTRGVAHPPELRAEVVAAIASGLSVREVARQFGLDPTLVSRWATAGVATIATQKRDLDELIHEYFEKGLKALIVQAEVFGDPEYCRAQDADKLAIAHGVLGDKLAGFTARTQTMAERRLAPADSGVVELDDAEPSVAP